MHAYPVKLPSAIIPMVSSSHAYGTVHSISILSIFWDAGVAWQLASYHKLG